MAKRTLTIGQVLSQRIILSRWKNALCKTKDEYAEMFVFKDVCKGCIAMGANARKKPVVMAIVPLSENYTKSSFIYVHLASRTRFCSL